MASNDWGDLEAQVELRLQAEKVQPVPAPIVKMAQKSLDGVPHPETGDLMHALQYEAPTVDKAVAFVEYMRNAGAHTHPKSTVRVTRDPDRVKIVNTDPETGEPVINAATGKPERVAGPPVNPRLVVFRAGERPGRKVANGT